MISRKVVTATVVILLLILAFSTFKNTEEESTPSKANLAKEENTESDHTLPQVFDRRNIPLLSSTTPTQVWQLVEEVKNNKDLGNEIHLSIDGELQNYLYDSLVKVAESNNYTEGAGVIMDITTGELISLVSYSQSDSKVNNSTQGLFVPGSIIKPFIAIAALKENIITPQKEILSLGSISLRDQNGEFLIFKDWKAHGYIDMRKAIGVSSNVYFYAIGGGYEDQEGLGIEKINRYLELFGIGQETGIKEPKESAGQIPNPKWKEEKYNGNKWRLADTYLTSIGQHGYAVTPIQMTRAVAGLASFGYLPTPTLLSSNTTFEKTSLPFSLESFQIVKEGMKYSVVNGTASGLYMEGVTLAAKTGTAEADANKEKIHSWLIGYFPYNEPKYAFTFMLGYGPWGEETGAVSVAENVFKWLKKNRPEYLTNP